MRYDYQEHSDIHVTLFDTERGIILTLSGLEAGEFLATVEAIWLDQRIAPSVRSKAEQDFIGEYFANPVLTVEQSYPVTRIASRMSIGSYTEWKEFLLTLSASHIEDEYTRMFPHVPTRGLSKSSMVSGLAVHLS